MTGFATRYTWHREPVPQGMTVRQVYGWIFDDLGLVVVWLDGSHVGLPGGRPEPGDADWIATLRREVDEEINAEIADPRYLGYQRVQQPDKPDVAQVRMIARLTTMHSSRRPGPDTGKVKTRLRVTPDRAADLLGWGTHGYQQATDASRLAHNAWGARTR